MDPYIQVRLRHYKSIGVKRVRARASGRSDECSHCKALDGLVYDIDNVPTFPPRDCTCPVGCGCRVTQVLNDAELSVTVRDEDTRQSGQAQLGGALSPDCQAPAPDLRAQARENWTRFVSGAGMMIKGAGELLRASAILSARFLARGAAQCIHLVSTTFPGQAKQGWTRAKFMLRQRRKSLTT